MGDSLILGLTNRLLNDFTRVPSYTEFVSVNLGEYILWFKFPFRGLSTCQYGRM